MVKIQKKLQSQEQEEQHVNRITEALQLEEFGYSSGFYQKQPKKITASGLVMGFWKMQHMGKNTLRNWAVQVGLPSGQSISRQSLNERLEERAVELVKGVLNHSLNRKSPPGWVEAQRADFGEALQFFNRIVLHDSTFQQLPSNLKEVFAANYSQGERKAGFRLQALFNLTDMKWLDFSVDTYSINDQRRAPWPLPELQSRDLLLRDLGYFTLDSIEKLVENQYLISKWQPHVTLYKQDGSSLDFLALATDKKQIDIPVLLGSKKRIPMRLVARRLSKTKAAKRIKAAKKDRHAKANHSEYYYKLLRYEIYLTNVPQQILNPRQIAKLYGLRWYIEILFKSWKSYFNFKKMFSKERMKYHRVLVTIYCLLIQFIYLTNDIYPYINLQLYKTSDKLISILKFMDLANDLFLELIRIQSLAQLDKLIKQFERHATYEPRRNRINMREKYLYFKELRIINNQT